MALDRLKSVASHLNGTSPEPHPFDPLSSSEIETAVQVVREQHGQLQYNTVSLYEPRKAEMTKWLANPTAAPKPKRIADVVVIAPGGKLYDGLVDLKAGKIIKWEYMEGVQPLVSHLFLVLFWVLARC